MTQTAVLCHPTHRHMIRIRYHTTRLSLLKCVLPSNSVCICYSFFAPHTDSDDDPKLNHNHVKDCASVRQLGTSSLSWRPMFSPRPTCGIFGAHSGNGIGSLITLVFSSVSFQYSFIHAFIHLSLTV